MEDQIEAWVTRFLGNPKNLATESELREQSRVAITYFQEADSDHSGTLEFSELKRLCDQMGLPLGDDEEEAMMKLDTDDSGALDLEEWATWWLGRISSLPNPAKQQEAIARNTFKKFDRDGSGYIDAGELQSLVRTLGATFTDEELEAAIAEMDTDQSGVIEADEFVLWWTNRSLSSRGNVTSVVSLKLRKLAAKAAQVFHTDIFNAAWQGDEDLVKSFLEGEPRLAKAHDESDFGEQWTALQYACYRGHQSIVAALLEAQANVNAQNKLGFTALFYAAQRGHLAICNMLMEKQADPTIVGSHPDDESLFLSPLDHIADYPELKSLFMNHPKCSKPPIRFETDQFEVSVAPIVFQLTVTLPRLTAKQISSIPLQSFRVLITLDAMDNPELADEDGSLPHCELLLPAPHPNRQPQTASGIIPANFIKFLRYFACAKKLNELRLQGAGQKADVLRLWEDVKRYYLAVDSPSLRKKINLEAKFLAAVDRGNSEDLALLTLQSTFRSFLSQNRGVTAVSASEDGVVEALMTLDQLEEFVKQFVGVDQAHAMLTASASQTNDTTAAAAMPKSGSQASVAQQKKSTQSLRGSATALSAEHPTTVAQSKAVVAETKAAGGDKKNPGSSNNSVVAAKTAVAIRQTVQVQIAAVTSLLKGELSDSIDVVIKL